MDTGDRNAGGERMDVNADVNAVDARTRCSPRRGAPRWRPARAERGFTLVEVVVALGVLVSVLASVATVWISTAAATRAARQRTLAIELARDKLEQVASLTWGVRSVDGVDLLTSDDTADLSRRPATAGGFGTRPSPADSLRVSRSTYTDYLDPHGRWVGAGTTPSAGAHFVRRWWIGRAGVGASELLLFEVTVTTLTAAAAMEAEAGGDRWWRRHPDAAWLCGAKLRRSVAS